MATDKSKAEISTSLKLIDRLFINYAGLQKIYRNWAKGFKNYREVVSWLKKKKIATRISVNQKKEFNLLSSDWNPTTIAVLREEAVDNISLLKNSFNELSRSLNMDDLAWYLIYFIHPALHELYYFNDHYTDGYHSRLPTLLHLPRIGLKSIRRHLENEGNTIHDSFCKAFCITMFKFIHIHPTLSISKISETKNLERAIGQLRTGENSLLSDELSVSMGLSTKATITFETWIEYAPCAINEGPIFILKKGKSNLDCFREIVRILQSDNPTQTIIREKLKEYYQIEE